MSGLGRRGILTPSHGARSEINFKTSKKQKLHRKVKDEEERGKGQPSMRSNMTQFSNMSVGTFF